MEILISEMVDLRVNDLDVEVVERKGIGHPDSLTDGMVEAFSQALSRYYLEKFGHVLHHNVDKALLVGGHAKPEFGGGIVETPILFYLVGRATDEVNGKKVPVNDLFQQSVKNYVKVVRNLDVEKHIKFECRIRPGSPDLVDLFMRGKEIPLANDTSYGVGFYPFTETEKLVLRLEKDLNSEAIKEKWPWIGEDIKVMAIRRKNNLDITLAVAFVSKYIDSERDYFEKKQELKDYVRSYLDVITDMDVNIAVNTADAPGSVYITVTGTSAEGGDDGQVGRGNRVNGLITPLRPMTLEAAAGKNPISHVGKLYNLVANEIVKELVSVIPEIKEAYALLVSQIGKPITDPHLVKIWIDSPSVPVRQVKDKAEEIVHKHLEELPTLYKKVLNSLVSIF